MGRYPYAAQVGLRLQALRERQGLSVRALAKKAQMPHNNLLKIERGETNVPIETLARLADALGVNLRRCLPDTQESDEALFMAHLAVVTQAKGVVRQLGQALGMSVEEQSPYPGLKYDGLGLVNLPAFTSGLA